MATDAVIDARGLRCPLPALKLEKHLDGRASGHRVTVLATDPMAKVDIPWFCQRNGHACALAEDGDTLRFEVTVGG